VRAGGTNGVLTTEQCVPARIACRLAGRSPAGGNTAIIIKTCTVGKWQQRKNRHSHISVPIIFFFYRTVLCCTTTLHFFSLMPNKKTSRFNRLKQKQEQETNKQARPEKGKHTA
jgi:hypothetical protein